MRKIILLALWGLIWIAGAAVGLYGAWLPLGVLLNPVGVQIEEGLLSVLLIVVGGGSAAGVYLLKLKPGGREKHEN